MDGFAITMRKVFQREGESIKEFFNELQALTDEDKKWYYTELNKAGFICSEPGVTS